MPDYTRTGNQDFGGNSRIINLPPAAAAGQPVTLEQMSSLALLPYVSGRDYTIAANSQVVTSSGQIANSLRACPWLIRRPITIIACRSEVSAAATGTTYRMGIYTDTGAGYPKDLVAGSDVASLDAATAGVKLATYATPITLSAGLYWQASNFSGAVTMRAVSAPEVVPVLGVNPAGGGSINYTALAAAQTFGALPATYPAGATLLANSPPVLGMYRVQ